MESLDGMIGFFLFIKERKIIERGNEMNDKTKHKTQSSGKISRKQRRKKKTLSLPRDGSFELEGKESMKNFEAGITWKELCRWTQTPLISETRGLRVWFRTETWLDYSAAKYAGEGITDLISHLL